MSEPTLIESPAKFRAHGHRSDLKAYVVRLPRFGVALRVVAESGGESILADISAAAAMGLYEHIGRALGLPSLAELAAERERLREALAWAVDPLLTGNEDPPEHLRETIIRAYAGNAAALTERMALDTEETGPDEGGPGDG